MANFTYLRFYWNIATTITTTSSLFVAVSDFTSANLTVSSNCPALAARTTDIYTMNYRLVAYASNTSVTFGDAKRVVHTASGQTGTTVNQCCIPTKICGCK